MRATLRRITEGREARKPDAGLSSRGRQARKYRRCRVREGDRPVRGWRLRLVALTVYVITADLNEIGSVAALLRLLSVKRLTEVGEMRVR